MLINEIFCQKTGCANNTLGASGFNKKRIEKNQPIQNPTCSTTFNPQLLEKYYISFGAGGSLNGSSTTKKELFENNQTQEAQELIESASKIAKKCGHKEINEYHIFKASLENLIQHIDDLDNGVINYDQDSVYDLQVPLDSLRKDEILETHEKRALIRPIMVEQLKELDKIISKQPATSNKSAKPKLSSRLINIIADSYKSTCSFDDPDNLPPLTQSSIFGAVLYKDSDKAESIFNHFVYTINSVLMLDKTKPEERIHLKVYDDKAKNIFKNLSLGTNMFVTYENGSNPKYVVNSLIKTLQDSKEDIGKFNPKNTKIIVFNENTNEIFFAKKIKELEKDTKHNYVIVLNDYSESKNESVESIFVNPTARIEDIIKKTPKNINFVCIQNKNEYFSMMADAETQKLFENFSDIAIPIMSTEQATKAFIEQPLLMGKIEKPFTRKAIEKVIEASAQQNGNYPEKAQKIMKKLAAYYIDKKEITEKDVINYIKEAKDLFKIGSDESSVEVIFDTDVRLKNLLGKESTKKEATAIVRQIKNETLGTKGAIIYSQDGSVGAGRKYTAKAIAGESKSPYIEINAMDFGTKDVDILGGGNISPEASIKKLFSLVKSRAESNPHKSAVLFVENFEYFSVGEMVSEYHQKAMSQLLREMENASKKGLNILVLGSVGDPELIGDSTMKSFKFIDKIEIASPARNINAREEILRNFIKERKLKVAGATEEEKNAVIKLMAETADRFPMVYLINLVDKTKTVSLERGHKEFDRTDVIEAYLQLTSGRPSSEPNSKHRKEIVTSHECGHALNEEVIWNLAQKQNIPWHVPDRVNFITLDPRGDFGGAMYPKDGGNEENSFEKTFSELVCDYGGHSCEKRFYNIDGSWGITCDLEMATSTATQAVQIMGQGHHTGKISIAGLNMVPTGRLRTNMDKDVNVLLKNALLVSDIITEEYAEFNREFTAKYAGKVGTGECLIHGDDFRKELADWIERQSPAKRKDLDALDGIILEIIEASKKGKLYAA